MEAGAKAPPTSSALLASSWFRIFDHFGVGGIR